MQEKKISVLENSRGRFVGIQTAKGASMNARYVGSSENYVTVFDRNSKSNVKMAKTSVVSVTYGGETFR